jgi:hypothetical protein
VLKPDGGRCRFEFGEGAQLLLLALPAFAGLETLLISLREESDFDLELRLANGSLLEGDSHVLDCQRFYQFRDHPPTQSLLFIFRSRNGSTAVDLKMIDLQGAFVARSVCEPAQDPLPAVGPRLPVVGPRLPFVETKGKWDAKTRTHLFEFKKLITIRTIVFRVPLGKIPGSLIVAFFRNKQLTGMACIIIPEVRGTGEKKERIELTYHVDFLAAPCGRASLFYLDRVAAVEPHPVMFC